VQKLIWVAIAFLVLVLLGEGLVALGSPMVGACDSGSQQGAPHYGKERYPSLRVVAWGDARRGLSCVGRWADANHDDIAAASTFVIAVFTFTLWRSTRKLGIDGQKQMRLLRKSIWVSAQSAKATRRLAGIANDTLVNAERPYIYAFGVYKFIVDKAVVGGYTPFIRYSVANYGKTPGVIEEVLAGISTSALGRPKDLLHPEGTHWLVRHPVFAPAERRDDIGETLPGGIPTKPSTTEEIILDVPDNEDLFFWIIIRYRGPFSRGHETSACWRLDQLNNRFAQLNDPAYNYER